MTLDLLTNIPATSTTHARTGEARAIVPVDTPFGDVVQNRGQITHETRQSRYTGSPDPYTYAFEALMPLADWLEDAGKFWRVGDRRCWSLEEVVRAMEITA